MWTQGRFQPYGFRNSERSYEDKLYKNGSSDSGNGYWYFSAPKYNSYRVIEISDSLVEVLLREKERQDVAKEYYGSFYTYYFAEQALTFHALQPEHSIGANRIFKDIDALPIHLICVRENGTFISPRAMQHTSRVIRKEIFAGYDFIRYDIHMPVC